MVPQAWDLIERARNDSRIDFDNDWKLVTLWVGGNDLCGSCTRPVCMLYSLWDQFKYIDIRIYATLKK